MWVDCNFWLAGQVKEKNPDNFQTYFHSHSYSFQKCHKSKTEENLYSFEWEIMAEKQKTF